MSQFLYKADNHQWGQGIGKTHRVNEDLDKTLCGRLLTTVPGRLIDGNAYECDCKACLAAVEREKEREIKALEWQDRQRQMQAEREAADREWWEAHQRYCASPDWSWRHESVLERENWLCEACRKRRATQVHHATYKHWRHEPLFELHAVCDECHKAITRMDREARAARASMT